MHWGPAAESHKEPSTLKYLSSDIIAKTIQHPKAFDVCSFVPHPLHLHFSPPYDVLDQFANFLGHLNLISQLTNTYPSLFGREENTENIAP